MADSRKEVVIDAAEFDVPDDVIDMRGVANPQSVEQSEETYFSEDDDTPDISFSLDDVDGANASDVSSPDGPNTLQTPQWLKIVNQNVTFGPDGTASVDVILECEDVDGASKYEIRVTK